MLDAEGKEPGNAALLAAIERQCTPKAVKRLMDKGRSREQAQLCLVVKAIAFTVGGKWEGYLAERARLHRKRLPTGKDLRTQIVAISNRVNGRPQSARPYPSKAVIEEIDRVVLRTKSPAERERILAPVRYLWEQVAHSPLVLRADAERPTEIDSDGDRSSNPDGTWDDLSSRLDQLLEEVTHLRDENARLHGEKEEFRGEIAKVRSLLDSANRAELTLREMLARLAVIHEMSGTKVLDAVELRLRADSDKNVRKRGIRAYLQAHREALRAGGRWPPDLPAKLTEARLDALIDGAGTMPSWPALVKVVQALGGDVTYVEHLHQGAANQPDERRTRRNRRE